MTTLLTQLADALTRGTVKVVDLTQPLGPATPVIGLPPIFAASPGVTIDEISRYDEKGPGWARWLEIRGGPEQRRFAGWVWPVCFVLIGLLLVDYREA